MNELYTSTSDIAVPEVYFCGIHQFVRRFSLSNNHFIGDIQLDLSSRGNLDNISIILFEGVTNPIPNDSVEVQVYSVGLNFKDVSNNEVKDKASDFAGVVTGIPPSIPVDTCPYTVYEKVYGLRLDIIWSKDRIPINKIAKMPKSLSFEKAT